MLSNKKGKNRQYTILTMRISTYVDINAEEILNSLTIMCINLCL